VHGSVISGTNTIHYSTREALKRTGSDSLWEIVVMIHTVEYEGFVSPQIQGVT